MARQTLHAFIMREAAVCSRMRPKPMFEPCHRKDCAYYISNCVPRCEHAGKRGCTLATLRRVLEQPEGPSAQSEGGER